MARSRNKTTFDKLKYEIANETGINLKEGYNGDLLPEKLVQSAETLFVKFLKAIPETIIIQVNLNRLFQ